MGIHGKLEEVGKHQDNYLTPTLFNKRIELLEEQMGKLLLVKFEDRLIELERKVMRIFQGRSADELDEMAREGLTEALTKMEEEKNENITK